MRTVSDDEDGGVRQNGVSSDDLGCAPTVVPRDRRPGVVRSGLSRANMLNFIFRGPLDDISVREDK